MCKYCFTDGSVLQLCISCEKQSTCLLHLDKQETKLCVTSKGAGVKASTLSHNNRELTLCCSGPGVGGGLSIHKEKGEPRDVTVLFRV